MDTLIHDFIESRAIDSIPKNDLIQLGYEPDAIYRGIATNPLLTYGMIEAMDGNLADYAMTFFTFGVCIEKERHARENADDFPPTAGE